ncbi:hypothetical protein E7Z57_22045 (plasmid) [Ralstonia pseudosolanacearum]|uniref:Uncharacterized protein n=1 Tax=Ralstonia solanacearum TaxID=305 RepID=A0AA92EI45_RALSL|nr:hypothetical protein E7Z57_22045 [Ralstonia pseudosolanacearum]
MRERSWHLVSRVGDAALDGLRRMATRLYEEGMTAVGGAAARARKRVRLRHHRCGVRQVIRNRRKDHCFRPQNHRNRHCHRACSKRWQVRSGS